MSVERCKMCDEYVDTDYYEGFYNCPNYMDSFVCETCVENMELAEEEWEKLIMGEYNDIMGRKGIQ